MNWFIDCITKNYVNFSGRARRTEYWMFQLFVFIIFMVLGFLGSFNGTLNSIFFLIFCIFLIVIILPGLAVTVRRLHDTGKSGWWILISLIPFGSVILLVFCLIDSMPGSNQYGANPKE